MSKIEKKYAKFRKKAKNLTIPEPPASLLERFTFSKTLSGKTAKAKSSKKKKSVIREVSASEIKKERTGFFSSIFSSSKNKKPEPEFKLPEPVKKPKISIFASKAEKLESELESIKGQNELLLTEIHRLELSKAREREIKQSESRILKELEKLDKLKELEKKLVEKENSLTKKEDSFRYMAEEQKELKNLHEKELNALNKKRDEIKNEIEKLVLGVRTLEKEKAANERELKSYEKSLNERKKEAAKLEKSRGMSEHELRLKDKELKEKEKELALKERALDRKVNELDNKELDIAKKTSEIKKAKEYGENLTALRTEIDKLSMEKEKIEMPAQEQPITETYLVKESEYKPKPKHEARKIRIIAKPKYSETKNLDLDDMISLCNQMINRKKIKEATTAYNQARKIFYGTKFSDESKKISYYNKIRILYDDLNLASLR